MMLDPELGDGSHPMDFLLTEELYMPSEGEIRSGEIVALNNNEILVDIGAKSEGVIPNYELSSLDADVRKSLTEGDEIRVFILDPEDSNGNIVLSYRRAAEEQDWILAADLLESQDAYESELVGHNRGGALVTFGLLRGFVPNSQLVRERFAGFGHGDRQTALQEQIGQPVTVKVLEVDRQKNRLILSERAASKEIRDSRKSDILANIEVGEVFEGQVVNVANFGAFVDIGGIEGLVHVSEITWKRLESPDEVVQKGDKVEVQVLNVDEDRQRIGLSMKSLEADPWTRVEEEYHVGQLIEAEIMRLTKFGAFARLDDDYQLEGLIHISEMAEDHVENAADIVSAGDRVTVRIIRLDPEQRQVGLSLKQVTSDEFLEADLAAADSEL